MPSIPTNFNDTAAIVSFARKTGMAVGFGFIIPAIVLSVILIFIFVKWCNGDGKSRQEFTSKARLTRIILAVVLFVICITSCVVAWTYNERIHHGVTDGTTTLQGVILSSDQLMSAVNGTVGTMKDQILDQINSQTNIVVVNMTGLFVPLNGVERSVVNAKASISNLTSLTVLIADNMTVVDEDEAQLQEFQRMGVIKQAPNPNDIPKINQTYVIALNESKFALDDVMADVRNITQNVNDTINEINNDIAVNLANLTSEYDEKANDVLSHIGDLREQISNSNVTYNKISSKVIHYSNLRKIIVAAILVLPLVLTAIALAGVAFKIKLLLKISAAFCFIFMFWYFLVAGLNFVAFYTLDQVCKNQDAIVANALAISGGPEINIPSANISINVSDKLVELLHCSGNNTLINIFEFNFLIDDLRGQVKTQIDKLVNRTGELNQTNNYDHALASLNRMENNSVLLDYHQNSNLPRVHATLRNITAELNETINGDQVFQSIAAVNNITNNDLLLNNGTTINIYYDDTNITGLNCTVDPYDQINSQSEQQELCTRAATAIELTNNRSLAIAYEADVIGNVTSMDDKLNGLDKALPTVDRLQNDTQTYSNQMRSYLTSAYAQALAIISQVKEAAALILGLILSVTNDLVAATQCSFLGYAYDHLSGVICNEIGYSLGVIAGMMIVGAVMLFFSAILSINTSYKIERDFMKKL